MLLSIHIGYGFGGDRLGHFGVKFCGHTTVEPLQVARITPLLEDELEEELEEELDDELLEEDELEDDVCVHAGLFAQIERLYWQQPCKQHKSPHLQYPPKQPSILGQIIPDDEELELPPLELDDELEDELEELLEEDEDVLDTCT